MEPQDNNSNPQIQAQIDGLKQTINELSNAYYRNNFSAHQDFTKYSNFTTRLKVPHYDSLPTTCEAGEIAESGGKLYIASSTDTWTVAGTQS